MTQYCHEASTLYYCFSYPLSTILTPGPIFITVGRQQNDANTEVWLYVLELKRHAIRSVLISLRAHRVDILLLKRRINIDVLYSANRTVRTPSSEHLRWDVILRCYPNMPKTISDTNQPTVELQIGSHSYENDQSNGAVAGDRESLWLQET